MKRIISLILSLVMVLSMVPEVFAVDMTLTEIVKTAKSTLAIPDEYTEFETEKRELYDETVYGLTWSKEDKKDSIFCNILSSGDIIYYENYISSEDRGRGAASFKKEEYLARAEKWIRRVCPNFAKELDFEAEVNIGNLSSRYANISFNRVINGVKVSGDYVSVSLDKYTGDIRSMNCHITRFEKADGKDGIISEEDAREKLFELSELSLEYKKLHDENRAILVFVPKKRYHMISASDGELFEITYNSKLESAAPEADSAGGGANSTMKDMLTEKELEEIVEAESLISKEEIAAKIKKLAKTAVASYTLTSVDYGRRYKDEENFIHIASATLVGKNNEYGSVVFDAKTGELLSIYSYSYNNSVKKGSTKDDELLATAHQFIKTHAPEEAEKVELYEENAYMGNFSFIRVENEIPYAENSISVYVDANSGKIMRYNKYWDDETAFEDPEGIISDENAKEKYIEAAGCELLYIPDGVEMHAYCRAEELKLIYRHKDNIPAYISARDGSSLNYSLAPFEEKEKETGFYDDLEGHFAKDAVKTLSENGIIFTKEKSFAPDKKLSKEELVRMLFSFEQGRYIEPTESEMKELFDEALSRGLIDGSADDRKKTVRRDEAASVIVRFLGYKKASEIPGIFKTGFSDETGIKKEYVGSVAIAKGLKIINGSGNGRFDPSREVTRGEFAVMLFGTFGK